MEGKSGGSKEKKLGESKGKEEIVCCYCEKKMRKDTLQRHTDNKHTRKEPKYRHVTEGISGLSRFGFSTSKQSVKDAEENIPLEPVEDPARDSDEVLNSSADTNDNFLERDDPEVSREHGEHHGDKW
jgi:hypothetical protein